MDNTVTISSHVDGKKCLSSTNIWLVFTSHGERYFQVVCCHVVFLWFATIKMGGLSGGGGSTIKLKPIDHIFETMETNRHTDKYLKLVMNTLCNRNRVIAFSAPSNLGPYQILTTVHQTFDLDLWPWPPTFDLDLNLWPWPKSKLKVTNYNVETQL